MLHARSVDHARFYGLVDGEGPPQVSAHVRQRADHDQFQQEHLWEMRCRQLGGKLGYLRGALERLRRHRDPSRLHVVVVVNERHRVEDVQHYRAETSRDRIRCRHIRGRGGRHWPSPLCSLRVHHEEYVARSSTWSTERPLHGLGVRRA